MRLFEFGHFSKDKLRRPQCTSTKMWRLMEAANGGADGVQRDQSQISNRCKQDQTMFLFSTWVPSHLDILCWRHTWHCPWNSSTSQRLKPSSQALQTTACSIVHETSSKDSTKEKIIELTKQKHGNDKAAGLGATNKTMCLDVFGIFKSLLGY